MRRAIGPLLMLIFCFAEGYAQCTVDWSRTFKWRDEITEECRLNSAGTKYVIIKEVEWTIGWTQSSERTVKTLQEFSTVAGVLLPQSSTPVNYSLARPSLLRESRSCQFKRRRQYEKSKLEGKMVLSCCCCNGGDCLGRQRGRV